MPLRPYHLAQLPLGGETGWAAIHDGRIYGFSTTNSAEAFRAAKAALSPHITPETVPVIVYRTDGPKPATTRRRITP